MVALVTRGILSDKRVWVRTGVAATLGVVTLVSGASAGVAVPSEAAEDELLALIEEHAPGNEDVLDAELHDEGFVAQSYSTEVVLPGDGSAAFEVSSSAGSSGIVALPDRSLSAPVQADDGSVLYQVDDGTQLVAQSLSDASLRLTVAVDSPEQPTSFAYDAIPAGGSAEVLLGAVFLYGPDGVLVGTFDQPWAVDSEGVPVPASYEVAEGLIVQHVAHHGSFTYPVVADPLFRRGIISRVNKESWNSSKGGYELQAEVTNTARLAWIAGRQQVIIEGGLADLREHYPRSMKTATMAQQWECHAVGLVATFKIDLEGWRASKPNWRQTEIFKALGTAIRKGDPRAVSVACNW